MIFKMSCCNLIYINNYNILIFMIPIPICDISRQNCSKVCIDKECQSSPFICNFCQDNRCQTIHIHSGKQPTKEWTEIASLVGNYLAKYSSLNLNQNIHTQKMDENNQSNQYTIRCLKNQQYSNIMGKSMRSLYNSMLDCKTQKQENQFKSKYQQKQYQEQKMVNSPDLQKIYFSEGQKMFKQKKYQDALELFQKMINVDRNNYKAYVYLKEISEKLQKQKQFTFKYSQQINRDSLNSINYIKRGCLYFALENYKDAIRDCDKAIQLDPKYYMAFIFRANAKRQLNRDQQGIKDYLKAIQLNPNAYGAYYGRGLLCYKAKQWQLAIKDYTKAIQINPIYCDAFNNRGIIYDLINQKQKALNDYNKAIELNPLHYEAYYNRANIYNLKKQYNLALIDYNKAIQLNLSDWQAYNNRSLLYQKLNQLQLAINDTKKIIQLCHLHKFLIRIGQLYFKLHKNQEAEAQLSKYIQLEGYNNKCYYYLGRIELEKGNLELSLAYFEKSIEVIAPSKPQYFLYLGIVKDLIQEYDDADDNYEISFNRRLDKKKCLESLKQIYKEIHKFRCEVD